MFEQMWEKCNFAMLAFKLTRFRLEFFDLFTICKRRFMARFDFCQFQNIFILAFHLPLSALGVSILIV